MINTGLKKLIIFPVLCLIIATISAFRGGNHSETITGNFTTKDHKQAASIITPELNADGISCKGGCITRIDFTNENIKPISIADSMGGEITNLGDLDNDGLDEIGFLPAWFAGCWHYYKVFTFKNNQWELAVKPFETHCNEFETPGIKPIVKDPQKPGNVLITYSVYESGNIVFKTISEKIK